MTDLDALHAALDAEPWSATLRLVIADELDALDDPLGEGYRAMGALGMHPCHLRPCPGDPTCDHWMWQLLRLGGGYGNAYTFDARRPEFVEWFREFCPRLFGDHTGPREGGRRGAEDKAARAFTRLPAATRAAILEAAGASV